MFNILVPTDFSDGALRALRYAVKLGAPLKANIIVANAYMMPSGGTSVVVDISDLLRKTALDEMDKVEAEFYRLSIGKEIKGNFIVEYGTVFDVINSIDSKFNIDLVVMGTNGASGLVKVLGSNTSAVVRETSIPVIAVPEVKTDAVVNKLLFATDFHQVNRKEDLIFLHNLAEGLQASISFIHVIGQGDEPISESKKQEYITHTCDILKSSKTDFRSVSADDVVTGIREAIETEKPDILVMVRHEYGFFEGIFHKSTTRELILEPQIPLMVLKD